MANQEEIRDVYGYFEQNGNALCYRYEAERVRIEPWGENSLRVREIGRASCRERV